MKQEGVFKECRFRHKHIGFVFKQYFYKKGFGKNHNGYETV